MKNIPIFVYGTLMKGEHNHFILENENVKYVGEGSLWGYELYAVTKSFPAVLRNGDKAVKGELYYVEEDVLATLDNLECEGYMYNREVAYAYVDGVKYVTYVYTVNNSKVFTDVENEYTKINPIGNFAKWSSSLSIS